MKHTLKRTSLHHGTVCIHIKQLNHRPAMTAKKRKPLGRLSALRNVLSSSGLLLPEGWLHDILLPTLCGRRPVRCILKTPTACYCNNSPSSSSHHEHESSVYIVATEVVLINWCVSGWRHK